MMLTFLRYLLRDLRRQPMRTFLTLSGVIWGTFAVVLLLAFGDSISRKQMKEFRGLGQGIMLLFPGQTTRPWQGLPKGRQVVVAPRDVEQWPDLLPEIESISPEFSVFRRIRRGRREYNNNVRGVNPAFGLMRNVIPARGRFLNDDDLRYRRRVCLVGHTLAGNLFGDENPVGQQIQVEGVPFLVVGVGVKKQQNSNYNGQRDEQCVFVPFTTFMALYGQTRVGNIILRPRDVNRSAVLQERLRAVLGPRLGFDPADKDALFIWDFADFEKKFSALFLGFKIFLGVVGSFTLLVGGVGVASIMTVVVEERTREIGVKLAVGAKRRNILRQFFAEALVIVLTGGIMGMGLAALLIRALPAKMLEEVVGVPRMEPLLGLITVGILLLIGVVAGLSPARRAAATDPIVALRG